MADTLPIHGVCDPRFTSVRDAFADNFAQHGDFGAAVCVYLEGKPVLDLWGGWADAARTIYLAGGYPGLPAPGRGSATQSPVWPPRPRE